MILQGHGPGGDLRKLLKQKQPSLIAWLLGPRTNVISARVSPRPCLGDECIFELTCFNSMLASCIGTALTCACLSIDWTLFQGHAAVVNLHHVCLLNLNMIFHDLPSLSNAVLCDCVHASRSLHISQTTSLLTLCSLSSEE